MFLKRQTYFLKNNKLLQLKINSQFLFASKYSKNKSFSNWGINAAGRNGEESKETEGQTIDINSDKQAKEQTIDMGEVIEVSSGAEVKISDIYSIKSKKMGPPNINNIIDKTKFTNKNVRLRSYNKENFLTVGYEEDRKFIPVSPKLGPFEILEPKMEGKTYHWCACGMSKKQPFCDGSHRNSKIRPVSFKLGEKCDSMQLCGCKLSTVAPFCDGKTCVELKAKEDEEIEQKIDNLNKK